MIILRSTAERFEKHVVALSDSDNVAGCPSIPWKIASQDVTEIADSYERFYVSLLSDLHLAHFPNDISSAIDEISFGE